MSRREAAIRSTPVQVLHEGFFALDLASGHDAIRDAVAIASHLEDLLIRFLLKAIKYEGACVSMIRGMLTPVPVDWVQPGLTPADLSFGVDRMPTAP